MCQSIKACPAKAKRGMESMFDSYAGLVSRCSACIFIIAVILISLLASGNRYERIYEWHDFSLLPEVSIFLFGHNLDR